MSCQPTLPASHEHDLLLLHHHHQEESIYYGDDSTPHFFVNEEIGLGLGPPPDLNTSEKAQERHYGQVQEDYGFFVPAPTEINPVEEMQEVTAQSKKKILHNQEEIQTLQTQNTSTDIQTNFLDTPGKITSKPECFTKQLKKQKNQYDKNMVANICSTVIRKMISSPNQRQIRFYCRSCKVSYREFMDYFRSFVRKNSRLGTSELHHFFSKSEDVGIQKVFSLFLIRFLNEEYLSYMLSVGKMSDQRKYMECAINLMYIPKISPQQKDLISQFHNLV